MKPTYKTSRVFERYGMIEALEARIAPASLGTLQLPANPVFVTVTAGGAGAGELILKAGEVLTTGSGSGGSYLLYVAQGEIMVHITDLNNNGQVEFNEITGISAGNGAAFVSYVDIHGPIVTDLNADGTLSDSGKGDILLDNNIAEILLRSLTVNDFTGTSNVTTAQMVDDHIALSSYSIFGNIYAGAGLGLANNTNSGLQIDTSGGLTQANVFTGAFGAYDPGLYQQSTPVIGSIYVGSSASGQSFSFGSTGSPTDIFGNLLAFNPAPGEAGASIYNITSAAAGQYFSIGTIHAGDGGFNAPGGNIVNVALQSGANAITSAASTYKLIAGNAGMGTTGQNGGSIINFSETGAFISEVVLQSGNGGNGLTGAGGNGGTITFNAAQTAVEVNAHFVQIHGSGGDGYGKGGSGGGTTSATFITPEGAVTTPENLVSEMHTIGSIGTATPIDFNGDGFSDIVYSTTSPNQVVVALGNYALPSPSYNGGFGFSVPGYIYLNAPANVTAITVGDFTGNGHPDIAVASGSGSNAGIEVFLSMYNAKTGAFEGFSDPLFSPIPSFFYTTTSTITSLVAGDFTPAHVMINGVSTPEPVMDLAANVQTAGIGNYLLFLNGEANGTHPNGSGYFYANTKGNIVPAIGNVFGANAIFEATALKTFTPGTGFDVVIASNLNDTGFDVISDQFNAPGFAGGNGWGDVLPPGFKNPVQFYDQTFTVTQDPTTPQIADVIAASQNPQAFIVTEQGNGTANGWTITSGLGINFGYGSVKEPVAIAAIPSNINTNPAVNTDIAIFSYDNDGGDTTYLLHVTEGNGNGNAVQYAMRGTIAPVNGRNNNVVAWGAYEPHYAANAAYPGSGPTNVGFVAGNPLEAYPDYQGLEVTQPLLGAYPFAGNLIPYKNAGYFISAGNGGNSLTGLAGSGGSFGQSLTVSELATTGGNTFVGTGTYSITFPMDETYQGTANITAGNGGNGFAGGGEGGNLVGISLTYNGNPGLLTGSALLFAGNGGQSLTGTGGTGGSESQLYIVAGQVFVAGNGGIGVIGGAGGSLYGNVQSNLAASQTNNVAAIIALRAGDGASGILGGGNGGSINSWVTQFNPIEAGSGTAFLNYVAGSGGNAVGGQAGSGGNVLNSSPATAINNLEGDVYLQSGTGGSGFLGGSGGNITNFANVATVNTIPLTTTFIAGNGGNATIGTGGAGGNITNISASSEGEGDLLTFNFSNAATLTNAFQAITLITPISYNRLVAGKGGASAGGTGGAGGSIGGTGGFSSSAFNINLTSVNATSQDVVVAGAGGAGLSAGGSGGNVTNVTADAGSTSGKVLVVAGDGGSSSNVAPVNPKNPMDVAFAIGGVNGPGGQGGSINTFAQSLSVNTHVDLIAGNGGATLNHSAAAMNSNINKKTGQYVDNSGYGGSITNISVQGSIGNSDPNQAIKSYNNILAGQTMQQFVDSYILGNPSGVIDDSVGNVGLVAGAAGAVEGTTLVNGVPAPAPGTLAPSLNGVDGSVNNVYAENIMSMVAGNVDLVAPIQDLTNYGVTIIGGIQGANKVASSIPGFMGTIGQLNYISPDGQLTDTPLPGGGALIDGAFVANNIRTIHSIRDFQGTEIEN